MKWSDNIKTIRRFSNCHFFVLNIPLGMYLLVENVGFPVSACRRYATLYRTHTWRHANGWGSMLFYQKIIPTGFFATNGQTDCFIRHFVLFDFYNERLAMTATRIVFCEWLIKINFQTNGKMTEIVVSRYFSGRHVERSRDICVVKKSLVISRCLDFTRHDGIPPVIGRRNGEAIPPKSYIYMIDTYHVIIYFCCKYLQAIPVNGFW